MYSGMQIIYFIYHAGFSPTQKTPREKNQKARAKHPAATCPGIYVLQLKYKCADLIVIVYS
jgi:hypothetical protein